MPAFEYGGSALRWKRRVSGTRFISRYKALADIERGFRVLKSTSRLPRCTIAFPSASTLTR